MKVSGRTLDIFCNISPKYIILANFGKFGPFGQLWAAWGTTNDSLPVANALTNSI